MRILKLTASVLLMAGFASCFPQKRIIKKAVKETKKVTGKINVLHGTFSLV